MKWTSKKVIFGISFLAGNLLVLGLAGYDYWKRPRTEGLGSEIGLSAQIHVATVAELRSQGYQTIIDLRPDGEAFWQPSSLQVGAAAQENGMHFVYIPVPHGNQVPDTAVALLTKALNESPRPVLLYCHSGRRAVRTWSLVEASRPGGLDAKGIQKIVHDAGHSVDDLMPAIEARVAGRAGTKGETR